MTEKNDCSYHCTIWLPIHVLLYFSVLFNWKNLTTIKDDFAFILQNDWGVIGVESFKNEEPLSVQLQVSSMFNLII